jgi:hypothetical protein
MAETLRYVRGIWDNGGGRDVVSRRPVPPRPERDHSERAAARGRFVDPQPHMTHLRMRLFGGTDVMLAHTQALIEKIQTLPADRLVEVEDFVDFIRFREKQRALTRDTATASAPAFATIWNNPEDDVYDAL